MKRIAWVAVVLSAGCAGAEPDPGLEVAFQVTFLEGPTCDADGTVYFSDIGGDRILKLSPDGKLSTFRERSGGANGNVIDAQGRLVTCEGKARRVTRTDLKTGSIEVLVEQYQGINLEGPNDVTFDGRGRIYFTDPGPPGQGRVYRIDPDGKVSRILAGPDIEKPNGVIISPDDRTFYLVESNWGEGGARMIRAYDLQEDGTVRNMRVFANFHAGRSMDGLSVDSEGNVYGAGGLNRVPKGATVTLDTPAGVHVFAPDGRKLRFIPIPEDSVTNCCFGGRDLKTLYVTAGRTLYKVPVDVAGTRR
jgi:gluconolactonase